MPAHRVAAARLAERVQLVDKDDAGGAVLRLGEQIADAGSTDADEHLDEVRAAHAEKGHVRLAGNRLGQEGLARAGRTNKENALGDPAAQSLIFSGVLEKIDDLAQLGHSLFNAGHVLKGNMQVFLSVELVPAAADR